MHVGKFEDAPPGTRNLYQHLMGTMSREMSLHVAAALGTNTQFTVADFLENFTATDEAFMIHTTEYSMDYMNGKKERKRKDGKTTGRIPEEMGIIKDVDRYHQIASAVVRRRGLCRNDPNTAQEAVEKASTMSWYEAAVKTLNDGRGLVKRKRPASMEKDGTQEKRGGIRGGASDWMDLVNPTVNVD